MEEEPFDVDCFFSDAPDDMSTLPHSSPAPDKTEQKGKLYSLILFLNYSIILTLERLFNIWNGSIKG